MCRFKALFIFFIVISLELINAGNLSRQKRCIVIQKQSGTHGDSTEAEDDRYDERNHGNRGRVYGGRHNVKDAEEISPEFLRYNVLPSNKISELLRLRNKFKPFKL
ncbi:unnamed protein product, partial [Brenthis ino]